MFVAGQLIDPWRRLRCFPDQALLFQDSEAIAQLGVRENADRKKTCLQNRAIRSYSPEPAPKREQRSGNIEMNDLLLDEGVTHAGN